MHRERAQGVDLFGHFHGSDFRRHRRADPASHHQPGQHRAELAKKRGRNDRADARGDAELIKLEIGLRGENRAGKSTGDDDHELREQPDVDHLPQEQPPAHPVRHRGAHRLGRENNQFAEINKERENNRADADEETGNSSDLPSTTACTGDRPCGNQAFSGRVFERGRNSGGIASTKRGSRSSVGKTLRVSRKPTA